MQPFQMILFAADFSENSKEAFRMACSLAHENKTLLVALHVVEPTHEVAKITDYSGLGSIPTSETGGVHEFLKQRLSEFYAPNHPIDVDYRTNEGDAAEEILCTADEIGADLIVMGTHGSTGLRRRLAGSVATAVLRGAHCAVLALQSHASPRDTEEIGVILHPTDSSIGSKAARRVARSLARDLGAKLVLLHVVPVAVVPSEWAVPVDLQAYRDIVEAARAS
jgi:nucleotide-binding universal stress UspA family protein